MNSDLSARLAEEFPQNASMVYLNHAAVGAWPKRTRDAVTTFARENTEFAALHYPQWIAKVQQLRQQIADLIQAPSLDDIALLKNTSEGLSLIAYGIDWSPGDNVVIADQEFPSNRVVWESLASRGVECRKAELAAKSHDPEQALIDRCDAKTRLLAVSSVQYATGLRMDLHKLGAFCAARRILFCIDAIQSIGALPFDARSVQADFVVADGHKWMLGPEGVALFYCRPEVRPTLKLHQFGWHMVQNPHDYDAPDWTPAASARRFECGSLNMLGIHALSASLSLLSEVGEAEVAARILDNTRHLLDRIAALRGYRLITPVASERHAGIVTFHHDAVNPDTLFQRLQDANIVCAKRGGGIRFSPHFYTPRAQLDQALNVLAGFS